MRYLLAVFIPSSSGHSGPPPPDWSIFLLLLWGLATLLIPVVIYLVGRLQGRDLEDAALSWCMGIMIGGTIIGLVIGIISVLMHMSGAQ